MLLTNDLLIRHCSILAMGSGSSKDGSSSDETYNIHGELVDIPESFAQVSIFKAFCLFMSPLSNQT